MADEQGNDVLTDLDSPASGGPLPGNGADTQPVAGIISQYVKDLSVENPRAPDSFQWRDKPEMDVQFNIGAIKINDELTEIELKVVATSKTAQGTAYIVDLSYCGLVGMRNMGEDQMHMFLYAEAPRILFPFARRIVADAVRDAGFAPLMLDPIDFNGLYVQQLANRRAQEQAGGAPAQTGDDTGTPN
ncbi:protein-export chaperone SecB [Erythrobacter arachoides]|uniref:Protein-export protein SecB n=1 Tax=Aurantiacibacter arachoides TaxID=1850444 RepID=A0A844ZXN5_9SPHN|nr:protein-export chaperone SecB [Aurantiacibacter arachoides]MXO92224.1 protein-export chaperone SecB [Aurantiacibacter arachoides]GGD58718.1 protein-export protein SecB [Aurantiacibacter arachoides]